MYIAFLFRVIKAALTWSLIHLFRKFTTKTTYFLNLVNLYERRDKKTLQDLKFIRALGLVNYKSTINLLDKSKSQLRQDLFVISESKYKKHGYFVEFGATDGIDMSNTFMLEAEFSWTGILAEPARVWEKQLKLNRPYVSIETLCVWKDSNSLLTFNETHAPALSTVNSFSDLDGHKLARKAGKKYKVHSISLNDLLVKHGAPKYIDYLSIDIEGSEYEVIKAFNFDEYIIKIITIEHNYTPQRELIYSLLTSRGYKRQYENISAFDDWYVKI